METSRLPVLSPQKNTSIPRSSRLPAPRMTALDIAPPERANTAKPLSRVGSIRSKPTIDTPSKQTPSIVPPSGNRRSSILPPGFVAPRPPSSLGQRPASPVKAAPTPRTTSRLAQRRPRPLSIVSHENPDHEDANDRLGSLDSFRASSRLGLPSPLSSEPSPIEEEITPKPRKVSRPSLSDRTIESLSQLPATPSTDRRRSGFFNPESPMVQSPINVPSRPASALSLSKRPGSSDGGFAKPLARPRSPVKQPAGVPQSNKRMSIDYGRLAASRRSISASIPRPSPSVASARNFGASVSGARPSISTPLASRTTARPSSVAGSRITKAPSSSLTGRTLPKTSKPQAVKPARSVRAEVTIASLPETDDRSEARSANSKSSAALRDQIARAKAAKRPTVTKGAPTSGGFSNEFDLDADPFNQRPKDDRNVLQKRIEAARADGRLNIAAMNLTAIPLEVMHMYDADQMASSNLSWNESVDLSRLIAADNALEQISDDCFPDVDPREAAAMENGANCQFAGLEMLDFHGNRLTGLPMGLCRLERLTTVNLSHNQLGNAIFEVVSQIPNLKELKLGHNNIAGYLPDSFSNLKKLEVLELQSNKLLSLPESLKELTQLRALNISANQLTGLPMDVLESLPITDLDVSKNALVGALFPFSVSGMGKLRELNVSNNSLASLAFSENLSLPAIRTLSITNNRIVSLPAVTGWQELITLSAADNKITELPSGFTSLRNLRHADLSSNDLSRLDERIALMDNLDSLLVDANPLKDKKFLSMSTESIKRQLRARLEPTSGDDEIASKHQGFEDEAIDVRSPEEARTQLIVSASGVLDLANRELVDEDADALRSFLGANDVRQMLLSHNQFTIIPFELSLAQSLRVLDMSMCALSGQFLEESVALPGLKELLLAGNKITSLDPLISHLHAPALEQLDVSNNRLTGALPILRQSFPSLTYLNASDNKIEAVSADSLRGLNTSLIARNNIVHLPTEIGLLWYEGLKNVDLSSNAFKVPNHNTLAKGTEAVMQSLRNRIPGYAGDDETF